jgi:hypothetical protein
MPNYQPKGAEYMRSIASRGGKASGKRRMITVPPVKRHLAAVAGANARWGKPALTDEEKKAHLQSWDAGVAHGSGWSKAKRVMAATEARETPDASDTASPPAPAQYDPVDTIAQIPEMRDVLSASDEPRVRKFLAALATPRYRNFKPATLARKFGLTPDEFANIWRDHQLRLATLKAIRAIPQVVEDLVQEAKASTRVCPRCDGAGQIATTGVVCYDCNGTGKVRQPGNPHAINLLFQLVGNPPKQQVK